MKFPQPLAAMLAVVLLTAGCMERAGGTRPNIFSDIATVLGLESDGNASPEQVALRQQSEDYRDYASARIQGAVVGAVAGAVLGAILHDDPGAGALAGGVTGGITGYLGASYLTRDHSEFAASEEALAADIQVVEELTEMSSRNVELAQSALNFQRNEIARLEHAHAENRDNAQQYATLLSEIEKDRQSVQSMISETEARITKMNASVENYRNSQYDTRKLEMAAAAQRRDIANLRRIENAMVDLISGAPSEDIQVTEELTEMSSRNVELAQSALDFQRSEIARLEQTQAESQDNDQQYATLPSEIERDQQSVQPMISETEARITKMLASVENHRNSQYDTRNLEIAALAQRLDIANLRRIENAMGDLISGAPSDVARPVD